MTSENSPLLTPTSTNEVAFSSNNDREYPKKLRFGIFRCEKFCEINNVGVVSKEDISINIPADIDLKDVLVKIEYKGPIYAPVQKGEQVANLIIEVKNYKKFEYPLFASSAINKVHYIRKIIQILKYKIKK